MEQEYHQNHRRHDVNPLFVGLLGVIAGAIIVATLHCMLLGWCNAEESRAESPTENRRSANMGTDGTNRDRGTASSSSMSNSSTVQLIPISKYKKGCNEWACAICLGEFTENDDLRVLPECAHPFHVHCIDKWLFSHPNCPLCRADIVPTTTIEHVVVPLADDAGDISSPDITVARP